MGSKENRFLIVSKNVVLTPTIENVIVKLDKFFQVKQKRSIVTSGLRTPEDQLRIIRNYLKLKSLNTVYSGSMLCKVTDKTVLNGEEIYSWQMGWSALLNAGIIINPPYQAKLLMDYVNVAGKNRKGDVFNQTPHANGVCFDIGGDANGINDELKIIQEAKPRIPELINVVVERANNCLHIDCKTPESFVQNIISKIKK